MVGLGVRSLRGARVAPVAHEHASPRLIRGTKFRPHSHGPGVVADHDHGEVAGRSTLQSIGVGLVHGISGTAAAALLAVSRTTSQSLGVVFLLVFAAAATLSMTGISFLLAMPLAAASRRSMTGVRWVQGLAGLVALVAAAFVLIGTLRGEG